MHESGGIGQGRSAAAGVVVIAAGQLVSAGTWRRHARRILNGKRSSLPTLAAGQTRPSHDKSSPENLVDVHPQLLVTVLGGDVTNFRRLELGQKEMSQTSQYAAGSR